METIGKCPLCGGDIIERPRSYSCANWRETGCPYTIWKSTFYHDMTEEEVKQIIENGETEPITFTSKRTGKDYKGILYWDNDQEKVAMKFPEREEN